MRTSIFLMATLAACGGGAGAGGGTLGNGGGVAASLGAALEREVGAGVPVAIVPTPAGLLAVSADGARQRVLVPGPIRWATVDNRAGVVWFGTPDASTIEVLDLESAAVSPAIATVVTNLPAETDAGPPLISIRYPLEGKDATAAQDLDIGSPINPHVALVMSAEPTLIGDGGILDIWEQDAEFDARVAQAKLPGAAVIQALATRGKGRPLMIPRLAEDRRVELDDLSQCEDSEECGRAEVLTPTVWRVVTSYSCGDACHLGWQLYDAERGALIEGDWAQMISDAWLAPDGSAFVTGGRVFRFDGGPLAATPATEDSTVVGGGWLGGGSYLP